jgi:CCR4-NOT transcription complex subunit 4
VIQKNLVYAIGLTDSISTNEVTIQLPKTLESDNYFGKYGRVLKTIINKSVNSQTKSQRNTCYVTYETELEASLAILVLQHMMQALDDYCLT